MSAPSVWGSSWMVREFGSCPNAIMSFMFGASTNGWRYMPRVPTVGGARWPAAVCV
ncbi:hypothetical protein LINPERPRIM_LOCUS16257 [Linum perenne]